MGCTSSKIDDFPLVALSRERLYILDKAIHEQLRFFQAHEAYINSLHSVSHSLLSFLDFMHDEVAQEVVHGDQKLVRDENSNAGSSSSSVGGGSRCRNGFGVVKDIQVQFERAAASGGELANVVEVGQLQHRREKTAFEVYTKMLNGITLSLPSSSKDSEAPGDIDEDLLRSSNLCGTLQKLYLLERKLFEEVKAVEKMRVVHDRKSRKLRNLDDGAAEPHQFDSTRSVVTSLFTKIRITIQIVDDISANINKVRDEELWPQFHELIQALGRMWKAVLECHQSQCQAIHGARGLDAIAFPTNSSDTHLEARLQLEHDLINWTTNFREWVSSQNSYARALNNWLLKSLIYVPEETAEGIAPFSPGREGAPPLFTICNQWSQSFDWISADCENNVIESMRVFAMTVYRARDNGVMKQAMTANRDVERKVKNLDREYMKIQKEKQEMDRMLLSSGASDGRSSSKHVHQSDTNNTTSLQASLWHVFKAMDNCAAKYVKAYGMLLHRSEDVVLEHKKVL